MAKSFVIDTLLPLVGATTFLVAVAFGCYLINQSLESGYQGKVTEVEYDENVKYELIEIEGMPCLTLYAGHGTSVTCDWSKWRGELP
ncbi:MAG: hypothetical protein ACW99U_16475 [Candidatus Thorarchaeota archaeon]|jgi:hypothetical protein